MAGSLAPQWLFQIFDDVGNVAAGAKLFSWVAGTTDPVPVYADYACTTPLANPYSANAAGRMNFWLKDGIAYRLRVETAAGDVICDRWPIVGTGSGGEAPTYGATQLEAFPPKDINWMMDQAGDLWNGATELAFRNDFIINGYKTLRFFRSVWSANAGLPMGKFAIYGDGATKLAEAALPDSNLYGIYEFPGGIDISSYDYLSVVQDPGISAAPQPIAQSIKTIPLSTASGRITFAHMVEHTHNTTFPDTVPDIPGSDLIYCLARWCAIGVQS